jgi:hypothetical protein
MLHHTYLWVRELNNATHGLFMGHLGIVWLLNLRNYAVVEGSIPQRIQSSSSSNTLLLLLVLVSIGSVLIGGPHPIWR